MSEGNQPVDNEVVPKNNNITLRPYIFCAPIKKWYSEIVDLNKLVIRSILSDINWNPLAEFDLNNDNSVLSSDVNYVLYYDTLAPEVKLPEPIVVIRDIDYNQLSEELGNIDKKGQINIISRIEEQIDRFANEYVSIEFVEMQAFFNDNRARFNLNLDLSNSDRIAKTLNEEAKGRFDDVPSVDEIIKLYETTGITEIEEFIAKKRRSLGREKVIFMYDKTGQIKPDNHKFDLKDGKFKEIDVKERSPILTSLSSKYVDTWNFLAGKTEGDSHPSIVPEPLGSIGNQFEFAHRSCKQLHAERDEIAKFFRSIIANINPDTPFRMGKESNVGFPILGVVDWRYNFLNGLSRDDILKLYQLPGFTVTGFRAQDEPCTKERMVYDNIVGEIVKQNKFPDQFKFFYDIFKGSCSIRSRQIAIMQLLNLILQQLATAIHKYLLAKFSIFGFNPTVDTPPEDGESFDFPKFDASVSPVMFEVFFDVLKEFYPVYAEMAERVYIDSVYSDGNVEPQFCEYSRLPHWGMPSGYAFVSPLNKMVAIYLIYVRNYKNWENILHRIEYNNLNNSDDNVVHKSMLPLITDRLGELGYKITPEEDMLFNGYKAIDGRWTLRKTSFYRLLKPEQSAGSRFRPQPWLGYLIGRAYYYQNLPAKDRHIVTDLDKFLSELFGVDFFKVALGNVDLRVDLDSKITYEDFLRLAKPDSLFYTDSDVTGTNYGTLPLF